MVDSTTKDHSLDPLLDLDGETIVFDDGSWVKFAVRVADVTPQMPHGIRYSLTLHDSNNTRILGYDNAHAIKPKGRKKFGAKRVEWDHKHQRDDVTDYHFDSAGQLMDDFWKDVDEVLGYGN